MGEACLFLRVNGEGDIAGGADIVREMFEQQELAPLFEKAGIALEPA